MCIWLVPMPNKRDSETQEIFDFIHGVQVYLNIKGLWCYAAFRPLTIRYDIYKSSPERDLIEVWKESKRVTKMTCTL